MTNDERLSSNEGRRLLALARASIAAGLCDPDCPLTLDPAKLPPGLHVVRGGFVTLRENGLLRGCIGEIAPRREIWRVVCEQARNAAFHDRRFPPVTIDEFDDLDIEISVLSPPRPVDSWRDIRIGVHGVVLVKGRASAVFLPQVAPEQGWDLEETLSYLALKAGLVADAWREGADFLVFEAQIFGEAVAG